MTMAFIKISQIESIAKAENAFHRLVDIAYVEEVGGDYILAIPDNPDLSDPAEFEWLKSIIERVMHDAGEKHVQIDKLTQNEAN